MEHLFPAYNDPLFSVILIVVIALIISMLTYGWGLHKQQREAGNLVKFLDKFDASECSLDTSSMVFDMSLIKPLGLLAKAFENTGEYPKAINIYLYLIKNIAEESLRIELMERLGNTYLHAGFLERSRSIYLEILRKTPRNVQVLYELGIVYEIMHDYTQAREVLEPLRLLGEQTHSLGKFLEFSVLLEDKTLSIEMQISQLKQLLNDEPKLYRHVIKALLARETQSAWESMDMSRLKEVLDILWFLPNSQLDLDIIASNNALKTLYYIKGYLLEPIAKSAIFSLDLLATAKQNGFEEGELNFSYLCQKCKQSFPVSFRRCPSCMAIHSVKVEEYIAKKTTQTSYSLL